MPKYVDADVLLEQMKLRRFFVGRASDPICIIEDAPAADVEPVRHGRWIRVQWVKDEDWQEGGYWILRCSECVMPYHNPTPCCPHCGAKMMCDDEIADGIGQTFSPD